MFKKKCSKCNNKVSKDYDFCPHCGNSFTSKKQDNYGFLGIDDNIEELNLDGINSSFMDKILENAMKMAEKMIEKQMKEFSNIEKMPMQNNPKQNNMEVQFFVNGKRVFPQNEIEEEKVKQLSTTKSNKITKEKAEKFSKFPKKEPASKVRRFSGKVIYELEMPEVRNINDILINQLENSIEIKALGKDKVYSKTLNINLPILGYKLEQGNLILELKA